jgi:hypothetical protein
MEKFARAYHSSSFRIIHGPETTYLFETVLLVGSVELIDAYGTTTYPEIGQGILEFLDVHRMLPATAGALL